MSYHDVWQMTLDSALRGRLAAAASVEATAGATLDERDADNWAHVHRYDCCSAPGWGDAWASALAASNPAPGADPGVITDSMILSQVQAVIAAAAA